MWGTRESWRPWALRPWRRPARVFFFIWPSGYTHRAESERSPGQYPRNRGRHGAAGERRLPGGLWCHFAGRLRQRPALLCNGVAGLSIEGASGDDTASLLGRSESVERLLAARGEAIDHSGEPVLLTTRSECFLVGPPAPIGGGRGAPGSVQRVGRRLSICTGRIKQAPGG